MKQIFIPTEEEFPRTADAVVIGGGIVGTATAFWLSRAGLDTVLVEMRDGLSTLTTPITRRFEVWRPDDSHRYLLFADGYCAEGTDLKQAYRGIAFDRGESLMGQVWLNGRPLVAETDADNQECTVFIPFIIDGLLQAVICFVF